MCRSNLEFMRIVVYVVREVIKVCRRVFFDMRWNCFFIELVFNYLFDLERGRELAGSRGRVRARTVGFGYK